MAIGTKAGSGDTAADTETPVAVVGSSSSIPSENTLLTPAQTYFADEKIQIPDIEKVFNSIAFLINNCLFL